MFEYRISIRKNMGKKYDLEWDHIFPYSVLKAHGYDWNNRRKFALAQEITNRAILTSVATGQKAQNLLKDTWQKWRKNSLVP